MNNILIKVTNLYHAWKIGTGSNGIQFAEKMKTLIEKLGEQFDESARLEAEIKKNFVGLGYEI